MDTIWLGGAEWSAMPRIGLGMSWQTSSLDSALGLFQ